MLASKQIIFHIDLVVSGKMQGFSSRFQAYLAVGIHLYQELKQRVKSASSKIGIVWIEANWLKTHPTKDNKVFLLGRQLKILLACQRAQSTF